MNVVFLGEREGNNFGHEREKVLGNIDGKHWSHVATSKKHQNLGDKRESLGGNGLDETDRG